MTERKYYSIQHKINQWKKTMILKLVIMRECIPKYNDSKVHLNLLATKIMIYRSAFCLVTYLNWQQLHCISLCHRCIIWHGCQLVFMFVGWSWTSSVACLNWWYIAITVALRRRFWIIIHKSRFRLSACESLCFL
jgi:hypothetical protein